MTCALDSNVVIALWSEDDALNQEAERALERASARGALVICGPVYVELRAFPGRSESKADDFLRRTGIIAEWEMEETIWREAARAGHAYSVRRGGSQKPPRRLATDFMIGAHAAVRGYSMLTLDRRTFRIAFPGLHFAPEST